MAYPEKVNDIGAFLDETSSIEQNIANIRANIAGIQDFQTRILGSTSSKDEEILCRERNGLTDNTKQLLIENKDRIRKIQIENSKISNSDPNFGLRKQRFEFLREKFKNVLDEYRGLENSYMHQQAERIARQYKVIKPNATQQEIDDYVSNPNSQPVFQQALLRTGEARDVLGQVQRRHEDIKNIEQTISELAALFQELNLQVEEQDSTILNIEGDIENTTTKLEKAHEDLGKARLSALAARKKKWICAAIALIIIIIVAVVLAIKLTGNKSSSSSSSPTTTVTVSPSKTTSIP